MPRGIIDHDGLHAPDMKALRNAAPPKGMPFSINRIGHVVLMVQDLEKSVDFYTRILGFRVSDVYPDSMFKGRMVFMRCNSDHHGVALVGGATAPGNSRELNHMAFEVSSLDEVLRARDYLKKNGVKVVFDGRRRAGCQVAVEFLDPDNHILEIYWAIDQVGSDGHVRPPEDWAEAMSLEEAIEHYPPGQDMSVRDRSLLNKGATKTGKTAKKPAKRAVRKA